MLETKMFLNLIKAYSLKASHIIVLQHVGKVSARPSKNSKERFEFT